MRRVVLYLAPVALSLIALLVSAAPAKMSARCRLKWRVVPSPRISNAGLQDVDALTRTDVWAVGNGFSRPARPTQMIVEHWDGHRWRAWRPVERSALPPAISASSRHDVWIVGTAPHYKPLTLHYDGQSWTSVPVPSVPDETDALRGVVALAPNNAWAVGQSSRPVEGQRALILHWDGSAWTRVAAPAGLEGTLLGVSAVSANDIWAVAPAQEDSLVGLRVIVVHWNGTIWREVKTTLRAVDFLGVRAVSARNVWAVGSTSGTAARGVVVHWNGRAFRLVHSTGRLGTDILSDIAVSGRQVWAVGATEIDRWDGRRWLRRRVSGVDLWGTDALSSRNVWAVGGNARGTVIYHFACR